MLPAMTTIAPRGAASAPLLITLPGTPSYDVARRAWNLHADQRPAAIAAATSVADVQSALEYARSRGLRVAAQTTGHFACALPSLHDTLLLKTVLHDGTVAVDPVARRARALAGAPWRDVVAAAAAHGQAVHHGSSPTVGVVGFLLGGGLGFYARAHGLAANTVHAFEVVTADGVARRASAVEHPELFWALRGGGGGFAVVTAVELGTLPYDEVEGGALFWAGEHADALLRTWRDWTRTAPDEVTTALRILRLPPIDAVPAPLRGRPVVCLDGVAVRAGAADGLVAALRAIADPVLGGWGPMPAAAAATMHGDPEDPSGAVADGALLDDLDDTALAAFLAAAGPAADAPPAIAELRQLGGALARPALGAGVRSGLEGRFLLNAVAMVPVPEAGAPAAAAVRALREAMSPWSLDRRFMNFAEHGATLGDCVPEDAIGRLRAVRDAVDPDRLLLAPHDPA